MLSQAVNGQRFGSADTNFCDTCGEVNAAKKCAACKMVSKVFLFVFGEHALTKYTAISSCSL